MKFLSLVTLLIIGTFSFATGPVVVTPRVITPRVITPRVVVTPRVAVVAPRVVVTPRVFVPFVPNVVDSCGIGTNIIGFNAIGTRLIVTPNFTY